MLDPRPSKLCVACPQNHRAFSGFGTGSLCHAANWPAFRGRGVAVALGQRKPVRVGCGRRLSALSFSCLPLPWLACV
jgi:hypothetical protein